MMEGRKRQKQKEKREKRDNERNSNRERQKKKKKTRKTRQINRQKEKSNYRSVRCHLFILQGSRSRRRWDESEDSLLF